ncbi:MAG: PQQ-binding-like beta-propeller repeat protein, partial [Gammaproteobacteria bacterium]
EFCRAAIAGLRNEGIFTPPSLGGTLLYPGFAGGMNWGGVAWHPDEQLVVTTVKRMAMWVRLHEREEFGADRRSGAEGVQFTGQRGTPYGMSRAPLLSPNGVPCSPPPWGTLVAVDLSDGSIRWEIPLGTTRDLAPRPFIFNWGVPNVGGSIVTAGGLIFIAATTDQFLRAFDIETGEELWKHRLPAGGQARPMTFVSEENGKQYVVIAAGGHGNMRTKLGDTVIAFSLPDS